MHKVLWQTSAGSPEFFKSERKSLNQKTKDVDADKSLEEVSDVVYAIVVDKLKDSKDKPIGRLWSEN